MEKCKKSFVVLLLLIFVLLSSCTGANDEIEVDEDNETYDEYAGTYQGEFGKLIIEKKDEIYVIRMYLNLIENDTVVIAGNGTVSNGTLKFSASDNYGNNFSGNIEYYADYYPARVELYEKSTGEYIDELEFERK